MEIFKILGHSMFPTLKNGADVLLKKTPLSQIGQRDIIVFKQGSQLICHRVIKVFRRGLDKEVIFYTKGDFNFRFTEIVNERYILGKVVGVYQDKRLKSLRVEHTRLYCMAVNLISFTKEALKRFVKPLY